MSSVSFVTLRPGQTAGNVQRDRDVRYGRHPTVRWTKSWKLDKWIFGGNKLDPRPVVNRLLARWPVTPTVIRLRWRCAASPSWHGLFPSQQQQQKTKMALLYYGCRGIEANRKPFVSSRRNQNSSKRVDELWSRTSVISVLLVVSLVNQRESWRWRRFSDLISCQSGPTI